MQNLVKPQVQGGEIVGLTQVHSSSGQRGHVDSTEIQSSGVERKPSNLFDDGTATKFSRFELEPGSSEKEWS